jgi:hypothetical protein
MAIVFFSAQEKECIRFLSSCYDQEDKQIALQAIPNYDQANEKHLISMIERFRRLGLIKWRMNRNFIILPLILNVAQQFANSPSADSISLDMIAEPHKNTPLTTFSTQEQEILIFLATYYDQEDDRIDVQSIPGYSQLGREGIHKVVERFRRLGIVTWETNRSITIHPAILDVAQQVTNRGLSAAQYHLFLSYASGDASLANELKETFENRGMQCFMAEKGIAVATQWEPAIREALRAAEYIVLLLTPRSIRSTWVLLETGAAWTLEKDIVPALVHISPDDLIDPIRRYQARVIETTAQRVR